MTQEINCPCCGSANLYHYQNDDRYRCQNCGAAWNQSRRANTGQWDGIPSGDCSANGEPVYRTGRADMTVDAKIVEIFTRALNKMSPFSKDAQVCAAFYKELRSAGYTICPPGWKAMPREPTLEMVAATEDCADCIGDLWRSMWDAAPGRKDDE